MDKLWKRLERQVADYFGGTRVPVTGRQRGDAPDIDHDYISFEVKHRAKLPEWLHGAMDQAIASMKDDDQIPTVILHEKYKRIKESYAMIRCDSYKKLMELYTDNEQNKM